MKQLTMNLLKKGVIANMICVLLFVIATILLLDITSGAVLSKGVEEKSQSYTNIQEACLDQVDSLEDENLLLLNSTHESELASCAEPCAEAIVDDHTLPIYEVYKNGIAVEVSAELQWMIRDFATEYGFDEKIIFGCILAESTFDPDAGRSTCSQYRGLTQIGTYWLYTKSIDRFGDNSESRDLYDIEDHLLTLMEIWCYAREAYGIDTTTQQGMKDLLYWHNTGLYGANVNWYYSDLCYEYASELVEIEY